MYPGMFQPCDKIISCAIVSSLSEGKGLAVFLPIASHLNVGS
jgi:hypothetical protein